MSLDLRFRGEALVEKAESLLRMDGQPNAAAILGVFLARYRPLEIEIPQDFLIFLAARETARDQIVRVDTGQPLRQFLEDVGAGSPVVSNLLDRESRSKPRVSYRSLLKRSTIDLRAHLEKHFWALFSLQQIVLDSGKTTGFNRHDQHHLKNVSRRVLRLLGASGSELNDDPKREKEAVIAAYLHDCGNIISRRYHGLYGAYLMTQLFTDVARDRDTLSSFLRVLEGVVFHEVELGLRVRSVSCLHPATLSLVVADKTDIGLHRVSSRSNALKAVRDAHTLVNLLTARSEVECQGGRFRWHLYFSVKANAYERIQVPDLLKDSEHICVPKRWQALYKEHNVENVLVFNTTFLRVYLGRLLYTIRAVFALYPTVRGFELVISDEERGIDLTRAFSRDNYEERIASLGRNLFKCDWEKTDSFRSLGR